MSELALPKRTVLHGIDESVEDYASLPARAHHGAHCVTEDLHAMNVWDGNDEVWKPHGYASFRYNVHESGGEVGWHGTGVYLPAGTLVLDGILQITETFESAGAATLTIDVEALAADILSAAAVGTLTSGALLDVVPVGTAATAILVTTKKEIRVRFLTDDMTAGEIVGFLRCVRGMG
jgi:hypothetical protein